MQTSVPPPGFVAPPANEPPPTPPAASSRVRVPGKLVAGAVGIVVAAAVAFFLLGSSGTRIGGPIAQAATLSSSAPGYRMHMSLEVRSSAMSAPITGSARGVVDLRDRATSTSMTMNLGDEPQVTQALGSSTLRIDIVTTGDVVYARLPSALVASLPTAGKPWMKLDVAKLSGLPGLSSLGDNPTTTDPNSMLQFLRSQSGNVVDEGPERVDGTPTRHYRAELSLAQLADSLPADQRGAVQQALSRLQKALADDQFPVDVWVDARNHIRRVTMALDLAIPNGPSLQETVTMDLSHYGPQRAPATPPPDQVMDLSSLAGASG